ncbi:TetR/AcrR family transcriptional regulator [Dermacoccus sp. 147Ba]|uniref:TetR/AcrR family transcriptional regulator n=1 Tax=Dermacoccus sp. 147Ba TaxID=2510111 RepID=UPI0013EAFD0B|nr:TetR/AcrR family transcriptional regulator [Dermacoccus sp. 147Ba]
MSEKAIDLGLTPLEVAASTPAGERILAAASRLFYERGIGATGVDLIALESDVTKRTLYQRFGSKENLVARYLNARAHAWQREVLAHLDGREPLAAIVALYDLAESWSDAGRGCAFVNAWGEVGETSQAVAEVVRAEKGWMRALFDTLAGSAQVGAVLHALYEGAQVNASIERSDEPFRAASAASKTWLAQGLSGDDAR